MSRYDEGKTMHEELTARGWLYLREVETHSSEGGVCRGATSYHWAAARLSDGLVCRAPSARELLAQIDAVAEAAAKGTKRPWWVPEGLGYDSTEKRISWPPPLPLSVVPPPRLQTPAEVCAKQGHIPSLREPGTCGSCGGPYVAAKEGGAHG